MSVTALSEISVCSDISETEYKVLDEAHRCPNADLVACVFCKLLNHLAITSRNFKLKNDLETAAQLDECAQWTHGLRRVVDKLLPHLARYDFDEVTQANGYRTFVWVARCGVTKCLYLVQEINDCSRIYSAQSHPHLSEKLIDWGRIFRVLFIITECLVEFVESSTSDSLFASAQESLDKLLAMQKERVNLVGFHGRLLGFQFCKSVRAPLRFISTLMGVFSEIYKTDSLITTSIVSSKTFLHYWRHPTIRAERVAQVIQEDPLNFFKSFWLIPEKGLLKTISGYVGEPVESNLQIAIPPVPITVPTRQNSTITIKPPAEYVGIKPVMVRLVSLKRRVGSVCSGDGPAAELSRTLIVHCHGGGFVAQSSNSHLIYLKSWARGVGAPIVSVDYSLAPEAPYPRALHEVLYAYLWAIDNAQILGSTAERIILAGDSAGGLMLTGLTLLCIELGVRIPDGLLIAYTPQLLETAISPARLLSLADPLLPYPALAACLQAYLGPNFDPSHEVPGSFVEGPWEPEITNAENCSRKFTTLSGLEEVEGVKTPEDDWHLSPLIAPDELLKRFPPTSVITTVFDPCMDDCVEFAKRLKEVGVATTLDVLNSLPHGFLNFGRVSEECYNGIEVCYRRLKSFVVI